MSEQFPQNQEIQNPASHEKAHNISIGVPLGNFAVAAAEITIPQDELIKHESGIYTGAVRLPDGSMDLSKAARITFSSKEEHKAESATTRAEQLGISEAELRVVSQTLRTLERPLDIELHLRSKIRKNQLNLDHSELLQLVRDYKKEQIKATEKGTLTHYHQTELKNLEGIVKNGGLLSTDEQHRRGLVRPTAGSRPDVVQMTRDQYDAEGKLIVPGINKTSANLGAAGEVTFIIDQSVMDDLDYDSIVKYPNVPGVSIEKISAVAVSDETKIPEVQAVFAASGVNMAVISRAELIASYSSPELRAEN